VCVGLIAFLIIVFLRCLIWDLSGSNSGGKEEITMRYGTHLNHIRLFGLSSLETFWAMMTSYAANALPA
jgi:hypothetical protein